MNKYFPKINQNERKKNILNKIMDPKKSLQIDIKNSFKINQNKIIGAHT